MKAESIKAGSKTYPETYLWVEECRSGQTWIAPIRGNGLLDLKHNLKKWVRKEIGANWRIDGKLMPGLEGEYYAKIMTDGRAPDSVVCWESGGFYLKFNEC